MNSELGDLAFNISRISGTLKMSFITVPVCFRLSSGERIELDIGQHRFRIEPIYNWRELDDGYSSRQIVSLRTVYNDS
jgi:hypothetical protein